MSEAIDYFVPSHYSIVDGRQAPHSTSPKQDLLEYNVFHPIRDALSQLSKRATTPDEGDDKQILSQPQLEMNEYNWLELTESYTPLEQLHLSSTAEYVVHGDWQSVLSSSEAITHPSPAIALAPRAPFLPRTTRSVPEAFPYTRNLTPEAYLEVSLATDLTPPIKRKRGRRRKPPLSPEQAMAKRTAFLQRNRDAASKCRVKRKDEIKDLENEERTGQQINQVLKDELKKVLGEIRELEKQVQDIPCKEDCGGCGQYAPQRLDKVVVGRTSLLSRSIFDEREIEADDDDQETKTSATIFLTY